MDKDIIKMSKRKELKMKIFINLTILFSVFLWFIQSHAQVTQEWESRYRGAFVPSNNVVRALAIDVSGNVYATGMSDPSQQECNATFIATVMYQTSDGGQNWANRYSGCEYPYDWDAGNSIAVVTIGQNTYVYVAGRVSTDNNGHDFVTIQYNAVDGERIWVRSYDGPGHGNDEALHIEVDTDGNAYVTGWSTSTNSDYVTIKYNSDGTQQWVKRYNGTSNSVDEAKSLKVASGYVYVTGTSTGSGNNNTDIVTIAYDSDNGDSVWGAIYNGGTNVADFGNDIAVDTLCYYCGVYVTGRSSTNIIVIRYDNSDGTQLYVNNNTSGVGNSIGLLRKPCSGNTPCWTNEVFVTGYTTISRTDYGITVKYDEQLSELWNTNPVYEDPGSFVDLAIDEDENVYVTGSGDISGSSHSSDFLTVKYSIAGSQVWEATTESIDSGFFLQAKGIEIDADGNCYITGEHYLSAANPNWAYYLTIKYSQGNGGDHTVLSNPNGRENKTNPRIPSEYALEQNYPNPFNSSALIEYALPKDAYVALKVYNLLGMEVALIVNEFKTAGSHSVSFDGSNLASGMYFYRLMTSSFTETKKMLLVK